METKLLFVIAGLSIIVSLSYNFYIYFHVDVKFLSTITVLGVEPTDSIRVVNAILTQIDKIKNHSNVLILTTSNLTGAIDLAFVDRADIKQFIDLPGAEAIYQIYYSCIEELLKTDIISPKVVIPPVRILLEKQHNEVDSSKTLYKISQASIGFSGRTLRKIPFLAHSLFIKSDTVDINTFYDAMILAITRLKNEKEHFTNNK